jgi:predicted ester cyclase
MLSAVVGARHHPMRMKRVLVRVHLTFAAPLTSSPHTTTNEGTDPCRRGQQGHRRSLVHRVLGRGLQPVGDRRARRPDIRFEYSLHAPCRGRDQVRAFATKFRAAFPDLSFSGTADLIAEGDYVVGQWEGGGTPSGDAFDDMSIGSLPPDTGKTMRFTGITILKVENGLITQELGLDDGVTVLRQLGRG